MTQDLELETNKTQRSILVKIAIYEWEAKAKPQVIKIHGKEAPAELRMHIQPSFIERKTKHEELARNTPWKSSAAITNRSSLGRTPKP